LSIADILIGVKEDQSTAPFNSSKAMDDLEDILLAGPKPKNIDNPRIDKH